MQILAQKYEILGVGFEPTFLSNSLAALPAELSKNSTTTFILWKMGKGRESHFEYQYFGWDKL